MYLLYTIFIKAIVVSKPLLQYRKQYSFRTAFLGTYSFFIIILLYLFIYFLYVCISGSYYFIALAIQFCILLFLRNCVVV